MMKRQLQQEELDAARLISALAAIASINTDPKCGWGTETLALICNHIDTWDVQTRTQIHQSLSRILSIHNRAVVLKEDDK